MIDELNIRKGKARYTGKGQLNKMKNLTYHHIIPVSEGGETTLKNGALLCEENHSWLHSQTKQKQKEINRALQEYKKCNVVYCNEVGVDFKVVATEISFGRKRERGVDR